ncbi:MAG TPA: sensor histidine kinase, partial [Mobilitalea sp.]|nr:sensor histidine kinase [Mobilitalea sp.]
LLDNAFKYSNPNGTIQVSLTVNNGRKIIKIYNTGLGILKTEKYKIFERFYRSDSSRARESGGYGLGLAIAKSIVDAHKGHISVDGKEGEWVAFSVIL